METYRGFAQVYDLFMDNVPYEEWSGYLTGLLQEYGIADGLVLDLGCGTGKLTRLLRAAGYDMIGIDNSGDGEGGGVGCAGGCRRGAADFISSAGYAGV